MVQFWLKDISELFNINNFTFLNNDPSSVNYIKVLNIVSLLLVFISSSYYY